LRTLALAVFATVFSAASGHAGTFTIEPASPLLAVPSGTVARSAAAPIPGVEIAPERSGPPPAYAPEYGRGYASRAVGQVPVPEFNPVSASWCQMDLSQAR